MRRSTLLCSPLVLAAAIATGATASAGAGPGIDAETILLGGTAPLSGPESTRAAVARGASAYLRHVNARGGVHGRTISYRFVDDAHDPAQTLLATRRLVEQERVFAIFNSFGTEQNEAVRGYLNARRVPQLFAASGATTFGADGRTFPWTIGFQPSYRAEGRIYGRYLARTKPGATIAVLHQEGAYGGEVAAGITEGLARTRVRLAGASSFESEPAEAAGQIARLRAAGADLLVLVVAPAGAIRGHVRIVRDFSLASAPTGAPPDGSLSVAFLKDPADARWRTDAAMGLYRSVLARSARGARANAVLHLQGMAVAYELVRVLKAAGPDPTRARVMQAARRLNDASNPFLLPGIVVRTSPGDGFPVEGAVLARWSSGRWRSFGGLWEAPGAPEPRG